MRDVMLILDFDHDVSRTAARMLRAEKIHCRILPGDSVSAELFASDPRGIILAGRNCIRTEFDTALLENTVPVLALGGAACFMAETLGGTLGEPVTISGLNSVEYMNCPLFEGLESIDRMIGQVCDWELPPILMPAAKTNEHVLSCMHMARPFYGLQLEMDPNEPEDGQILRNFAVEICDCEAEWTESAFVEHAAEQIRHAVGDEKALCCVTGGLDSAVSACIAYQALREQLQCVFIDTGFLREGEAKRFLELCENVLHLPVLYVDAKERFMQAFEGLREQDEKRRVLQHTMHNVISELAVKHGPFGYFVKGTNCSDKMYQSAASLVPGDLALIEPLEDLFKPEIKQVAAILGLPEWFVRQQPFPSGGLALRIMGRVTAERLSTLRFADALFSAELMENGIAKKLYKYYAMLLPGDRNTVVLRSIQAGEGTMASAARLPYDVIETVTARILQESSHVAHVVYDMTPGNYYSDAEW
ncbi:MAG: hypothetical protein IKT57_02515 [Clostridia bacterium]|nr:hypothetical protein [Clostridia bacterium]